MKLRLFIQPIIDLSYYIVPDQCALCGMMLHEGENCICIRCLFALPRTGFARQRDNAAAMAFWGRVDFRHVSASFYYRRSNAVQKLIQGLKYHGDHKAGLLLGQLLGSELKLIDHNQDHNLLIPVPLHPKKEKLRGYNQSLLICQGISEVTGWSIEKNILLRSGNRESQTKKNRVSRWENTKGLYKVREELRIEGKHVWLIDDVITTGSTLEACALALLPVLDSDISAAAVAFSGR